MEMKRSAACARAASVQKPAVHVLLALAAAYILSGCATTAKDGYLIPEDKAGAARYMTGHEEKVSGVAFSPDGSMVASAGEDRNILVWDAAKGLPLRVMQEAHSEEILALDYSPDGGTLASAGADGTVAVWDTYSGNRLKTFTKSDGVVRSVAFSPDGRYLAAVNTDETVVLWDANTSLMHVTLEGCSSEVNDVAFSPDGRLIATGGVMEYGIIWDVSNGKRVRELDGAVVKAKSFAFSPDGRLLAVGGEDDVVTLWDPATGNKLKTLEAKSGDVNAVAFSPDGKVLASSHGNRRLMLWDPVSGERLREYDGRGGRSDSFVFSLDGKSIALAGNDNDVVICDIAEVTGMRFAASRRSVSKPESKKEKTVAQTAEAPAPKARQAKEAATKAEARPKDSKPPVIELTSHKSEGTIKVTTSDYKTVFEGVANDESGVALVQINGVDAALDEKGNFSLPVGLKVGENTVEVRAVDVYDNVSVKKLKVRRESAKPTVAASKPEMDKPKKKDTTPPTIEVASLDGGRGIVVSASGYKTVVEGIARDESGVAWVRINGSDASLDEKGNFSLPVGLKVGENTVEVKAMDIHDNVSTKTLTLKRGATAKAAPTEAKEQSAPPAKTPVRSPAMWVLTIGVSSYQEKGLNLRFADNDARKVAAMLKKQEGKVFSEVMTKTLVNQEATKENILMSLQSFLGKAASDDVVFIFVAGHGVTQKQTGSYYFLPYNANADNLIVNGLRWSDFEEAIHIIQGNVNKVILVLDTCHSGAMKVAMRGVESGEDLAADIRQASGLYVLAASKGGEWSVENSSFKLPGEKDGHGAFTYSLLKGISGEANYDGDTNLTVNELFSYVSKHVPRITGGQQHPYSKIDGTDLPIAVVK